MHMSALANPESLPVLSTDGAQEVGGVQVVELDTGAVADLDQRPLVLINGIGAGNDNWGEFPRALGRRCVLADVSATEFSNKSPSISGYSNSLVHALRQLGYGKVDMLGLSWGGAVAQETAIRHSNQIGNLVLVATLPGWTSIPPKHSAQRALLSKDRSSPHFKNNVGNIYGGDIRQNPELAEAVGIVRAVNTSAYEHQLDAITTWWNHCLGRTMLIRQRTLIMGGKDDPIARPINSRLMAAAIPNSRLYMIGKDEGGGHLFLHTRPQKSAFIINQFLDHPDMAKSLLSPLSPRALTGTYIKALKALVSLFG